MFVATSLQTLSEVYPWIQSGTPPLNLGTFHASSSPPPPPTVDTFDRASHAGHVTAGAPTQPKRASCANPGRRCSIHLSVDDLGQSVCCRRGSCLDFRGADTPSVVSRGDASIPSPDGHVCVWCGRGGNLLGFVGGGHAYHPLGVMCVRAYGLSSYAKLFRSLLSTFYSSHCCC